MLNFESTEPKVEPSAPARVKSSRPPQAKRQAKLKQERLAMSVFRDLSEICSKMKEIEHELLIAILEGNVNKINELYPQSKEIKGEIRKRIPKLLKMTEVYPHINVKIKTLEGQLEDHFKYNYAIGSFSYRSRYKDFPVIYDPEGPFIFYARDPATFECLLAHGADPYIDYNLTNIVDYMEFYKNPILDYVKNKIGFSQIKLEKFRKNFEQMLEKEILIAKKYGKKMLVMIGEEHSHYHVFQVKRIILEEGRKLGIKSLMLEISEEYLGNLIDNIQLYRDAQSKLGMSLVGVDSMHTLSFDREDHAIRERNVGMREAILKQNKDAIGFFGSAHLKGLLQDKGSSVALKQYHILPINLTSLVGDSFCFSSKIIDEMEQVLSVKPIDSFRLRDLIYFKQAVDFTYEKDKVIQIESASLENDLIISDPDNVISCWDPKVEVEKARAEVDTPDKNLSSSLITLDPLLCFSSSCPQGGSSASTRTRSKRSIYSEERDHEVPESAKKAKQDIQIKR